MPFLLLSPGEIKLVGYALTDVAQFGVQILNFSIFLGLLIFFLKVPAAQFFRNRQDELRRLLDQSERDRLEGEQQIQELQIKMEGLQSELDQLLARAEHDANREKEMIIQSAKDEAAKLFAQSERDIMQQTQQAQDELKALAAELALGLAQEKIHKQLKNGGQSEVMDQAISHLGDLR